MSSLVNIIMQNLKMEDLDKLSQSIGSEPAQTKSAIEQALPLLISSLAGGSSSRSTGWSLLSNFLDKNHDGSILDDLLGMALGSGSDQQSNSNALNQILGKNQAPVQQHLENSSGLPAASIAKLLPMLAPIVIGALAKAQKTQNLDQDGVKSLLNIEKETIEKNSPESRGLIQSFLDKDGDGSVVDDLAQMGTNMLGKIFAK